MTGRRTTRVLTPRVWFLLAAWTLLGLGLLLGVTPVSVPADGVSGPPVDCGSSWFADVPESDRLLLPAGSAVTAECARRAQGQGLAAAVVAVPGLLALLTLMFDNMVCDRRRQARRD